MNLTIATNAPVVVTIEGKTYPLPPMRRKDFTEWAAELDAARIESATVGMNPGNRAKFISMVPFVPIDHDEICRHAFTEAGIARILNLCMGRASVPKETIDRLLEDGDPNDLYVLALRLARLVGPGDPPANDEEGKPADPLSSSGNASAG